MSLEDVPLDVPIPTGQAIYAWWEPEGVWVNWTDYVFLLARQKKPPAAERGGEAADAARSPLGQASFF